MCLHKDFYWKEVTTKQGIFKVKVCAECGSFLDDVVMKAVPVLTKDPNQAYYDGMFKCFDAVTLRYPEMNEDNREAMAVSLFIQIANS